MGSWFYLIPAAGVLALLFALVKSAGVSKQDAGNETMQEIAGHIHEGAMAFLSREYKVLAIFVVIVAVLLAVGNASQAAHRDAATRSFQGSGQRSGPRSGPRIRG